MTLTVQDSVRTPCFVLSPKARCPFRPVSNLTRQPPLASSHTRVEPGAAPGSSKRCHLVTLSCVLACGKGSGACDSSVAAGGYVWVCRNGSARDGWTLTRRRASAVRVDGTERSGPVRASCLEVAATVHRRTVPPLSEVALASAALAELRESVRGVCPGWSSLDAAGAVSGPVPPATNSSRAGPKQEGPVS